MHRCPAGTGGGYCFQLFGRWIFLTCNWFFYIYVVNNVSVKASAFAYLVCPVLTTVLAWAILKEYLSKGQWVAVLMSVAGCGILAFNHLLDLFYSMIIAFSYAFYLVSQRKNYGADRFLLLTGQVIFSALLLLPFYPVYSGPVPQSAHFYLSIGFMAVFLTIIPFVPEPVCAQTAKVLHGRGAHEYNAPGGLCPRLGGI